MTTERMWNTGVCQSTMVALSYPDCSGFIKTFSTTAFVIFPIGYAAVSIITLRGGTYASNLALD